VQDFRDKNVAQIAYFRVSTLDQSIDMQRAALSSVTIDREYSDEGLSGSILAAQRPGCAAMLDYVREGDTIHLYALDRLGRDAIDVQATVRKLLDKGVRLEVRGIGPIAKGVGEIVVAVLAQMADLERQRIMERCEAGRQAARESLAATGLTHRGKASLGRPMAADREEVRAWRAANDASIMVTARHFDISKNTVIRYCQDNVAA
jgi:putative DNA-invertase from lambdoid prophage Rac